MHMKLNVVSNSFWIDTIVCFFSEKFQIWYVNIYFGPYVKFWLIDVM